MKKLIVFIFLFSFVFAQGTKVIKKNGNYLFLTDSKISISKLPTQLSSNGLYGDILIKGTDKQEIRFTEKVEIDKHSKEKATEIWKDIHTKLEKDKFGYILKNNPSKRRHYKNNIKSIKYILDVPKDINIVLSTHGGDLNVNNINGEIRLSTLAGDAILKNLIGKFSIDTKGGGINSFNLEGNINLYTAGGDIECKNLVGTGNLKTMGGDISLESIKGHLHAKSYGGDIGLNDFAGKGISLITFGGDIVAMKTIGGLSVETKGGDILIEDVLGNVHAETSGGNVKGTKILGNTKMRTMGGDINIETISGSINAETLSGDINLSAGKMNTSKNNSIVLKTKNGSIKLRIAETVSCRIDATAEGFGSDIISDFDIDISKNPRETIGKGKINKGTNMVKLKVYNGDIIIKKIKK
ncbi:MAG: hypothetical protein U9N76_06065 [Candidatus Marinimicrobia bacterium]|nr:hypothetical protein [Candidatus Neomarinimicrobiota bacterium]